MTQVYPRKNELLSVCFGIIIILPAILITIVVTDFASNWDGPGPSPLIILFMPIFMFVLGGIFLVRGIRYYMSWPERMQRLKEKKDIRITQVLDPTTDQDGHQASSGYTPTPTINIPNHCSNCAAELSYEQLTWVGPMTFKCPSCGHEMQAERRGF